jgi:transposase
LVEKRTDFKNGVHAVLDKEGLSYDWDPFSVEGHEILAGEDLALGTVAEQLLESFVSVIDVLTAQIETLEEMIEETAASLEATQLLMTISGVSFYSSLLITSEIGEIERFDRAEEVVSSSGLLPGHKTDSDTRRYRYGLRCLLLGRAAISHNLIHVLRCSLRSASHLTRGSPGSIRRN